MTNTETKSLVKSFLINKYGYWFEYRGSFKISKNQNLVQGFFEGSEFTYQLSEIIN